MDYDVIIIGAGMSGLAAGIRLAYFDRRVCILEKHYAYGGLNSYYRLDGRDYDVGLHAVTNYAPPGDRSRPLAKLLRQLRIPREAFDLHPQRFSEIRFPESCLRFSNDVRLLVSEVARQFPSEVDRFERFLADIRAYDDVRLDQPFRPTRPVLRDAFRDPLLPEMLLCPTMYYGCAQEHDMDFAQFVTMFKSLFVEGFARPREGVRRIIKTVVRRFRSCGGTIRMRAGVRRLAVAHDRVTAVELDSGETLTAGVVLSNAGYHETMRLCRTEETVLDTERDADGIGRLSFVETIGVLDRRPSELGHDATIVFFNDAERFHYAAPAEAVDLTSGVACCPNNYAGCDEGTEGVFRLTWMANPKFWLEADPNTYAGTKAKHMEDFKEQGRRYLPRFDHHLVATDMFTPRTIRRFTGHLNGAVYGAPHKRRDGRTPVKNLFICGTDQGFLGIIGAMLSGITIANLHVLAEE